MIAGDKITYMCLAGIRCSATLRMIRHDGTVDIGCDVGSTNLHELTTIEVVDDLRPGTACAIGGENEH